MHISRVGDALKPAQMHPSDAQLKILAPSLPGTLGATIGPPADMLYAVEPDGVAMIRPSTCADSEDGPVGIGRRACVEVRVLEFSVRAVQRSHGMQWTHDAVSGLPTGPPTSAGEQLPGSSITALVCRHGNPCAQVQRKQSTTTASTPGRW